MSYNNEECGNCKQGYLMPVIPRLGEYPARLSLRVRPEDKHRLEELAYKARRPNGYILQQALDFYEAALEAGNLTLVPGVRSPKQAKLSEPD